MHCIHKVVVESLKAESGNTINSCNTLRSKIVILLYDSSILHFSVSLESWNPVIKLELLLLIRGRQMHLDFIALL